MEHETLYYFNSPVNNFPFYFSLTGITHPNPNYEIKRTRSRCTVVEYVVKGKGYIEMNGTTHELTANKIYILRQGSAHRYYSDPYDPWEKIFFNIQGELAELLMDTYGLSDVVFDAENLLPLFLDILKSSCDKQISQEERFLECAPKFHQLIIGLSKENKKAAFPTDVKKIFQYLSFNHQRIVPNRELAQLIFCSEDCLIKKFRKATGITPYEYQINEKIKGAKRLLRDTSMRISEIAEFFGYCDQHYFSNLFKSKTGKSPKFYRADFSF